jgi:hypothetical protein
MIARLLALTLTSTLVVSIAYAEATDDLLGGFDSSPTPLTSTAVTSETPTTPASAGDFSGSMVLSSAYNYLDHSSSNGTDWQGLSKLRTRLNLQYDYKWSDNWQSRVSGYGFYDWAYGIEDRSHFTNEVLDDYEHEADWQEVWLRGKLSDRVDTKIGRQVVNWGRADSLRVLDVLNPVDNREPGIADIEDLRLPVTMIKTDWFLAEHWQTSFIMIPEVRFSKNPPYGSDFAVASSPLFGGKMAVLDEEKPEHVRDSSYAMSLNGTFSGWDISFHAAQLWRDTPYLHVNGPINPLVSNSAKEQLSFQHSEITMLGTGANFVAGSWLLKTELAHFNGIDYTTMATKTYPFIGKLTLPADNVEKSRTDFLVGLEYFGFSNTALSLEVVNRHIDDFEDDMKPFFEKQDRMETALRYTGNFMNDRLELTALGVAFGERAQEGSMMRFQAAYDIQDALVLTTGVVTYQYGDIPPFTSIDHNDRVFAELKYSF